LFSNKAGTRRDCVVIRPIITFSWNELACGKISIVNTQQAGALKTDIEACVDRWRTVMGMHETEQHGYNREI
jgi:hypothetical protein